MKTEIKIIEHKGNRIVNARELHQFLGSKQEFTHWILNRIRKYGFIENQDYTSFDKIIKRETGATTRIEYALTIDTAKEVSMVENNDKGRIARRYFIEAEKQRNLMLKDPSGMNRLELLKLATIQEEKRLALEEDNKLKDAKITNQNLQLRQAAPKIEYHDQVLNSKEPHNITVIAKNFNMSAKALNNFLFEEGVQFRTDKKKYFNKKTEKWEERFTWVPYAKYQNEGYCQIRTTSIKLPDNTTKSFKDLVWFEKGQKFIYNLLLKKGAININPELNFEQ